MWIFYLFQMWHSDGLRSRSPKVKLSTVRYFTKEMLRHPACYGLNHFYSLVRFDLCRESECLLFDFLWDRKKLVTVEWRRSKFRMNQVTVPPVLFFSCGSCSLVLLRKSPFMLNTVSIFFARMRIYQSFLKIWPLFLKKWSKCWFVVSQWYKLRYVLWHFEIQ